MKISIISFAFILIIGMTCCSSDTTEIEGTENTGIIETTQTTQGVAQVTNVTVSGEENRYVFSVTIASPDLGCDQYADWWEVIDLEGNLLFRRVLAHSHVTEQPFTRSGGSVPILENTEVYVRAHMNTTSYGSVVFKGSVSNGFSSDNLDGEFARVLENTDPLPNGCAF